MADLKPVITRADRVDFLTADGKLAYEIRCVGKALQIRTVDHFESGNATLVVVPEAGNAIIVKQG
jgi:hypothetical protein